MASHKDPCFLEDEKDIHINSIRFKSSSATYHVSKYFVHWVRTFFLSEMGVSVESFPHCSFAIIWTDTLCGVTASFVIERTYCAAKVASANFRPAPGSPAGASYPCQPPRHTPQPNIQVFRASIYSMPFVRPTIKTQHSILCPSKVFIFTKLSVLNCPEIRLAFHNHV